jgi:hypothetical protein
MKDRRLYFYGNLTAQEKRTVHSTAHLISEAVLKDRSADFVFNIAVNLMVVGLLKKETDEPDRVIADVGDATIQMYADFQAFLREQTS